MPYALHAANVFCLERITEGSSTGHRLVGRDPDNHANLGMNTVDLSYSNSAGGYGASGQSSTAMGKNTFASGFTSIALRRSTIASGTGSLASYYIEASGDYSLALGLGITASGNQSTALGSNVGVQADYATAVGLGTTGSWWSSLAMGNFTQANARASKAIGEHIIGGGNDTNWEQTDPLFKIGNGTIVAKSNALTVLKNGYTTANGTFTSVIHAEQALTFGPGWSNYGSGYKLASYYKDNERVYVSGLASGPISAPSTIGVLPFGYRPSGRLTLELNSNINL